MGLSIRFVDSDGDIDQHFVVFLYMLSNVIIVLEFLLLVSIVILLECDNFIPATIYFSFQLSKVAILYVLDMLPPFTV